MRTRRSSKRICQGGGSSSCCAASAGLFIVGNSSAWGSRFLGEKLVVQRRGARGEAGRHEDFAPVGVVGAGVVLVLEQRVLLETARDLEEALAPDGEGDAAPEQRRQLNAAC